MNTSILDRLCCPSCAGEVTLHPFEDEPETIPSPSGTHEATTATAIGTKIIKEGVLLCEVCRVWYPISSYIPVMLVFPTPFHRRFASRYADRLREHSQFRMPHGEPKVGEQSVQETFTDEWNRVQDDEFSFTYTATDLENLNEKVWLKWVNRDGARIGTVLNVGCGLGQETLAVRHVTPSAEVYAVDLNFGLLQSGERWKTDSQLHFIIASLFHLPFRPSTFDLVYSQGVIHHTYSTLEAFNSIARYVRKGGHLFIWVYGLDDHLVLKGGLGFITRARWHLEAVLRPLISRSPKPIRNLTFGVLTALLHTISKTRVRHKDRWKAKNTDHGLRDWLSPRFAHRHSYNEVFEWFDNAGFTVVDTQSTAEYRRLFGKRLWGVGVTGQRNP